MSEQRRSLRREDIVLLASAVVLGVLAAAAFAAYRAVNASGADADNRFGEFVSNLLWPGVVIFGGVAGAIVAGWKANID